MNVDDELWAGQAGRCAGCGVRFLPGMPHPHLDHDHLSLLVRGWLCGPCNVAEGQGTGRIDWEEYRRNPPARRLGIASVWRSDVELPPVEAWREHDRIQARAMLRMRGLRDADEVAELTGVPVDEVVAMYDPEWGIADRRAAALIEQM